MDYGSSLPVASDDGPPSDYGETLPVPEPVAAAAPVPVTEKNPPVKAPVARRPLPPGPGTNSRHSRAMTASVKDGSYEQMRRALADSTPLIRLAASVSSKPNASTQVEGLDLLPPPKTQSRSFAKTQSLTQEQQDKAALLAASLRTRDSTVAAVADASLETDAMSVPEMVALLRARAGAGAADALERLVLEASGAADPQQAVRRGVAAELGRIQSETPRGAQGQRDWNGEFQELLEMEDGVDKYALLRALYSDFCYAALSYGQIIISERYLPMGQKTIRPASMGGLAGGEKFVVQNIVFKFAVDQEVSPGAWMYGGSSPCDEAAMKAASNELTGLVHVFKCALPGLHLPLAALIDLKGYRLAAFALLPIDKTSIVYGSADGGKTVVNKTVFANNKMKQLASVLNLMEHSVHGTRISLAADVEAHRGRDSRLYMVDFGRIFPPEAPREGDNARMIFHRLLRPELVKRSDVPLSSDAFSLFQRDDPKDRALNGQVTVATEVLHKEIIPQMGMLLSELQATDDLMLIGTIHRSGINVRHLGELRTHVSQEAVHMRRLLLSEMVARCIKVQIRAAMRERMKEYHLPSIEPYTAVLVDTVNTCFGHSLDAAIFWRSAATEARVQGRMQPIKAMLAAKFVGALTAEESEEKTDLRERVSERHVLAQLQKMIHFTLSPATAELLVSGSKTFVDVSHNDILSFEPRVTHMPIIDHFCGIEIALAAAGTRDENRARLVQLAEERFRSTLQSLPDHAPTFFQWGKLLHSQALRSNGTLELYASALEKFRSAMELDSLNSEFPQATAQCLLDFGKVLLQRAMVEHNKTFLRQALDKLRDALKLASVRSTRAVLELARQAGASSADFAFEASFQVLELIRKTSTDAAAAQCELLLEWAVALVRGIHFLDEPLDSLRCLSAAEKVNLLPLEYREQFLSRIDCTDPKNLLRLLAVSKIVPSLSDRPRALCARLTQLSLSNLAAAGEALYIDLCSALSADLVTASFLQCDLTDAAVETLAQKAPQLTALAVCGCISIRSDCLASVGKHLSQLRVLNLSVCFVSDEQCKELANLPNLERLNLSKTRVSGDAVAAVVKACKLIVLDLGGCANIGDKFFSQLAGAQSLATLILQGSAQLTSKALSNVTRMRLSTLDVSFCDKVDEKGIGALLKCDTLVDLYLKGGIQGRCEEKTLRKLQTSFNCIFDKTLAERVSPGQLFYDLGSELLVAQRKPRSPRAMAEKSLSRTSLVLSGVRVGGADSDPGSPSSPKLDAESEPSPRGSGVGEDKTSGLQRLSLLRKGLSKRQSISDATRQK